MLSTVFRLLVLALCTYLTLVASEVVPKENAAGEAASTSDDELQISVVGADGKRYFLRGPRKCKGEIGKTGERGARGHIGPKGDVGGVGASGAKGGRGAPGARGPIGHPGTDGKTGGAGPPGPPSAMGQKGASGDAGPKGNSGLVGVKGNRGAKGDAGITGTNGKRGDRGFNGIKGLDGRPGPKGDVGIGIKGARGITGPTGPTGAVGAKGEVGGNGTPGPRGISGKPGKRGVKGEPGVGLRGNTGMKGERGMIGRRGGRGTAGKNGARGSIGRKGERGSVGRRGARGVTGRKGERGVAGRNGLRGSVGRTGARGLLGRKGQRGQSGTRGQKGEAAKSNPKVSSCWQLKTKYGGRFESGEYRITLPSGEYTVYCEMGINGGGYTFIPRALISKLSQSDINVLYKHRADVLMRTSRPDGTQPYTVIKQSKNTGGLSVQASSHKNNNVPKNRHMGRYLLVSTLPNSAATNGQNLGFRSNNKNVLYRNCNGRSNIFVFYSNPHERQPSTYHGRSLAYERSGVAVNWRKSAVRPPSGSRIPLEYFLFTEMHFGGCGCYTSSDRWISATSPALGTAIGIR